MGYLTTITIRNDALSTIEDNKDDFMEKLVRHCGSGGRTAHEYFSVGNHANPVVLQTPRHADDHTIYVHMGNTVVNMNAYSKDTKEMMEHSSTFFDSVLEYMEDQVEELKKLKKNQK